MNLDRTRRDEIAQGVDALFKGTLDFSIFGGLRLGGNISGSVTSFGKFGGFFGGA